MTDKEHLRKSHHSQNQTYPSEVEITEAIQKAAQQYEEFMRLADLADISTADKTSRPRYSWDNPIGLVATGASNAKLG